MATNSEDGSDACRTGINALSLLHLSHKNPVRAETNSTAISRHVVRSGMLLCHGPHCKTIEDAVLPFLARLSKSEPRLHWQFVIIFTKECLQDAAQICWVPFGLLPLFHTYPRVRSGLWGATYPIRWIADNDNFSNLWHGCHSLQAVHGNGLAKQLQVLFWNACLNSTNAR